MNFDLLTAVLKSDLPCAQRMILTVVLNHAGQDNRAWPSHPVIAAQAGLAERSVWGHLRDLESSGWLIKVGNVGRVAVWEVKHPANSAGSIPQPLRDIPQILPDAEKPIPQILRDDPANSAGHPANSASLSRKNCELTTHEPHKNQPLTTQQGASESPPSGKAKASKPDWREWNRQKAEEANAVQKPLLAPPEVVEAWMRFCAYRTRRATEARIATEAIEWTRDAAEGAIRSCERHADQFGWPAVVAQIDTAIAGGWRGLNFQNVKPAAPFRQPPNRHGAYTPERAHAKLAGRDPQQF